MKPKDFKFPFKWDERRPCIVDGVFFVPWHYQEHHTFQRPDWEEAAFFGKRAPIAIEYCSGNGSWIAEKARDNPETNWIAVERRFERVRKIWSKIKNYNLTNLVIICGEAEDFTKHYVESSSVEKIYINFPDPWPKAKHAKNRLLQREFAEEISRITKEKGEACFVTDDAPYCSQMIAVMHESKRWESRYPEPFFISKYDGYGSSYFAELWQQKGRDIHYMHFINTK